MYTKNKRKYQNKSVQRSTSRSAAPAPKFKNKKEKFLKETLPCIVLLIFMAFWSIGSALSIIDRIKFKKDNSSMITASAEDTGIHDSVSLIGLKSTYINDGDICLFADNLTLAVSAPVGGFVLTSDIESVSYMYEDLNNWKYIECNFYNSDIESYTTFSLEFKILNNSYTLLDSTYRLTSIFYSQYDTLNSIVSVSLRYYNGSDNVFIILHLRSEDRFDFVIVDSVDMPVDYGEQYVNNLRMQINDLNMQINQLNSTISALRADISAMEDMHDYEIEQLNAQLLSLSNTIAEKNALIEELEARIREITIGNDNAYQLGYDTGYNDGYGYGYSQGSLGNDYSFTSLIGAVIDVPVTTFTSLFDWNLLGINLKQFFLSILSVMAILCAVKLILR